MYHQTVIKKGDFLMHTVSASHGAAPTSKPARMHPQPRTRPTDSRKYQLEEFCLKSDEKEILLCNGCCHSGCSVFLTHVHILLIFKRVCMPLKSVSVRLILKKRNKISSFTR